MSNETTTLKPASVTRKLREANVGVRWTGKISTFHPGVTYFCTGNWAAHNFAKEAAAAGFGVDWNGKNVVSITALP